MPAQVDWITNRSIKWAELKRKENLEKKVAVIYYNYPSGKDNVATASYLDGVTSICKLLEVMKENGYDIDYVPEDSDELLDRVNASGIQRRVPGPKVCLITSWKTGRTGVLNWFP